MMRRPTRVLVALVTGVTLPVLAGCYTTTRAAVPQTQPGREALDVRGVVLTDPDDGSEEVLEFSEVHEATWTPTSLSVVADVSGGTGMETITRLFPITEIQSVMVREFDAGGASLVVGAILVGTIAVVSLLVTGRADEYLPN